MKIIKSKSNYKNLLLNGKIEHIINPWYFELNLNTETITIKKRNWYFIGHNIEIISFRFIRKITINEHIFGGNIIIKALNNIVSAKFLPKKDLEKIKESIISYNNTKSRNIIIS